MDTKWWLHVYRLNFSITSHFRISSSSIRSSDQMIHAFVHLIQSTQTLSLSHLHPLPGRFFLSLSLSPLLLPQLILRPFSCALFTYWMYLPCHSCTLHHHHCTLDTPCIVFLLFFSFFISSLMTLSLLVCALCVIPQQTTNQFCVCFYLSEDSAAQMHWLHRSSWCNLPPASAVAFAHFFNYYWSLLYLFLVYVCERLCTPPPLLTVILMMLMLVYLGTRSQRVEKVS